MIRAIAIAAISIIGAADLGPRPLAVTALGEQEIAEPLTITFPASEDYTISLANIGRALVGPSMARVPVGLTQNGTNYAVDIAHTWNGVNVGANCTTWNSNFSGYTRGQALLTAGAKTGAEVAAAVQTAFEALGVTGITRDGATLSIARATNGITGLAMTTDESLRGMWGRQKVNCGDAPTFSAVNATVSIHITTPSTTGRVLGLYMSGTSGTRSGSMRMGYATGPAYSTTPAAFSAGQEGLVTRSGDVAILLFPEPIAMPASSDRWITWRTNTAAAWNVETRPHGSSPVARGDLTLNERVLINATITNPATAIYTAGAYTHTNSATGTAYAAVGLIYELPTGGIYYGQANIDTWLGYHGAYNAGTPSTDIGPTTLDGLTDTPRIPVPWDGCELVELRQGCNAISATEDFGFGIYDCSGIDPGSYPMDPAPALVRSIGRANASTGAGYKNVTVSPAIDLTGISVVGLGSCAGNIDGSIPATTVTIVYTPPGTGTAWNAGDDGSDGRAWDDFLSERGGYGADTQYISTAAGNPNGAPAGTWPDPLDEAGDEATFNNHPRVAIRVQRAGLVIA